MNYLGSELCGYQLGSMWNTVFGSQPAYEEARRCLLYGHISASIVHALLDTIGVDISEFDTECMKTPWQSRVNCDISVSRLCSELSTTVIKNVSDDVGARVRIYTHPNNGAQHIHLYNPIRQSFMLEAE